MPKKKSSDPALPPQAKRDNDPIFVAITEPATGFSLEDAYRILAGQPRTPVKTPPIE